MIIWVDADACPNPIKQIIFRAGIKRLLSIYCVANHPITVPPSRLIQRITVSAGLDKADDYIIQHVHLGDLVITADVILADSCVTKGATALNPRGELYTPHTIKQALAIRNFNQSLRDTGIAFGGPAPLSKKDLQNFSQNFDKILTKYLAKNKKH